MLNNDEYKQTLTLEKHARQEAEKSLRQRDEFISIAAHELNTPLAALTLQLHLLKNLSLKVIIKKIIIKLFQIY